MAISGPRPSTPAHLRLAGAAVGVLLTVTLTACGGDDPAAEAEPAAATTSPAETRTDGDGPRLVQGGEPGDDASEVPSDTTLPEQEWTHDDEMFMQMMIPHHAQALEMSELAATRAGDERVKRLAARISAAQGPEISMMAAWLDERELRVPRATEDASEHDHSAHGHAEMSGMLTEEQMAELAAARGTAFDRLFLERMIGHHEGALEMVTDTAAGGLDVIAGQTRDDVTSSQSAEIARMRQLLDQL